MPCLRCEVLPTLDRSPGRLILWFPLGHSGAKARKALEAAGFPPRDGDDGSLVVEVPHGRPEEAAKPIGAILGDMESEDKVRGVKFKHDGRAFSVYGTMQR